MDLDAVFKQLQEERRHVRGQSDWFDVLPHLTRCGSKAHGWADVSYSELSEDDAEAAIEEQVAFFAKMSQEFEWTVFGTDGPADLKERLARHGFEIGPREAVMIYDLEDGLAPFSQVDCRVVRITTIGQIEEFRGVAEAVFEKDYSRTCGELAAGLGSTYHLGYIAYDGDQPVGIGRLYTLPGSRFGGLYGGGTLVSHRGRGFYRALVGIRAQDAQKFGARYLRVDALPTSRPILERMGFTHLTDTWPCTHG